MRSTIIVKWLILIGLTLIAFWLLLASQSNLMAVQNIKYHAEVKNVPDPSIEKEEALRRQIFELYYYLYDQVKQNSNIPIFKTFGLRAFDQIISLMAQFQNLELNSANKYRSELEKLTDFIQQRIYRLQHPILCEKARILICEINMGRCQVQRVGYCLRIAAASNRTMIINHDAKGWRYSDEWTSVFKLPSNCLYSDVVKDINSIINWTSIEQTDRLTILRLYNIHIKRPPQLPLSFPKELADKLITFHSNPAVFFGSQFYWYVTRNSEKMKSIRKNAFDKIDFKKGPIVGLQIRRTDKINQEAAFYSIDEYIHWAEVWFRIQEKRNVKAMELKRRIYIATDDADVFLEAKENYPNYEILGDFDRAQHADPYTRYENTSLYGIVSDIEILSSCNFVVCTFSSNICRLVFELMQIKKGDATNLVQSLDRPYFNHGQYPQTFVATENHYPTFSSELELRVGDIIWVNNDFLGIYGEGNHWNGYSTGRNMRTRKRGLYPSYKTREISITVDFPLFAE